MKTLTVTNQKGGIGKTTTAQNLGAALGRAGRRVLLVDVDPQANLTRRCGINVGRQDITMFNVFVDQRPIADVVRRSPQGFDVACGSDRLLTIDTNSADSRIRLRHLREALAVVEEGYDYCLIDTAPCLSLRFLIVSALLAADGGVVIPFTPNTDAVMGVRKLMSEIDQFVGENENLRALAIVPIRVRDIKIQQQLLEQVRGALTTTYVAPSIVEHADFDKAEAWASSIFDVAPNGPGARSFAALAEHVIQMTEPTAELRGTVPITNKVAEAGGTR